ncbi:MAG: hypothetical protein K5682_06845, partial [Lachnospiraceae bacterium]|nr:hypothetical protein [Lachnospiraceae bacterium]
MNKTEDGSSDSSYNEKEEGGSPMKILLVMDMQKKYMHLYDRGLVERVNAQIRGAKSAGAVVVYMRNKGTEQEAE